MIIDIREIPVIQKQQWLQYTIGPRPICFASTIDKEGNVNLSPFSFFNLFSINPPIVIFSPSRRVRDNTTKHTLQNILEVPEVVINICDYDMVQQVSLSSCEFHKGIDEFVKAGFTKETATLIRPPMVKESKVKLECKVNEIKSLGEENGSGQLVIAEVLRMHVAENILNEEGTMIDQQKLHLIARLGGDWYSVVNEMNLFKVEKPNAHIGIGIDNLPMHIRNSTILTGNNLGQLANVHQQPAVDFFFHDKNLTNILQDENKKRQNRSLYAYAKELLEIGKIDIAWQVLLKIR